MLERVELIARLTSEGASQERDREIALNLIAELASGQMMTDGNYSVTFSVTPTTKK
ncbi:Tum protein [Siccibacter turicensis]|uniref:Tum protein n=2 Tax=Siccibacter turicensis TaxID=357233 RepID=A0A2P8VFY6_9ENTR|nr:Tum protein [Siccibacter turicensis]